MNKKVLDLIRIIFTILSIGLMIITIWMILQKLLGHSPTEISIMFSVIGILVSLQIVIISILFSLKGDVGELREFKRQSLRFQDETISKISKLSEN
ncbi:hypothetical protein CMI42_04200 [Candidatus Pacearchaeota archaeon]|nr:hypothetical protein [Candidatus Pacearchaeota archaeon]|tara:strand:+ start:68 stop:355 length:288 start_codon:yes stop_codon:yes gene_type:complete